MRGRWSPVGLVAVGLVAVGVGWQARAQTPAARGDLRVVLVGQALIKKDLRPIVANAVAQAREYLRGADVAFTNLEATVAPPGAKIAPRGSDVDAHGTPDVLECLKEMGFNLLSLANNHAFDLREGGIATTREEVARLGFGFAGTGKNADEAAAAGYMDTRAGRVALVAMASGASQLTPDTWAEPGRPGVNFLELRKDDTLNPEQKERILGAVRTAAREAALVIVYQHSHYWGEARGIDGPPGRERRVDRFTTPAWMERWARELIDAGASIYVAHGNPALHGVEIYNGKLILYGLGNFIFQTGQTVDRYGPLAWYSAVVDARFTNGRVTAVGFTPLVLAMDGEAQGAPFVAQGGEAAAVLGRLADVSRPYGTSIRIDKERARVELQ